MSAHFALPRTLENWVARVVFEPDVGGATAPRCPQGKAVELTMT